VVAVGTDDAVDLRIEAEVPVCSGLAFHNDGAVTLTELLVHYRVLGISHTATIDIGNALTLDHGVFCM
jgi:hypothetical protein